MPRRNGLVGASVRISCLDFMRYSDFSNCSVKQQLRSGEVHVRGDQWPIFLYAGLTYHPDDPWNGLFRNQLLVIVSNIPRSEMVDH